MLPELYSEKAAKALWLGEKNHVTIRKHGWGMIDTAFHKDGQVYEPISLSDLDFTTNPIVRAEAIRRVEILKRGGVPIKGYILRHEAPKELTTGPTKPPLSIPKVDKEKLVTIGGVVLTVLTIAGVIIMYLLAAAVVVDPGLICVLDDEYETQVEVMTWLASSAG